MPEQAQPARQPPRARRRLAALSLVGALMVALPLGQVLRYQNNELHALEQQRAGLDPMTRAVDVQRSLLLHRDVAGRVLRGRATLEDERRVRQGEVDDTVAALALALVGGGWELAMRESDALREDWSLLARRLLERSLNASQSDQAHRLLVEQSLQVMDLLVSANHGTHAAVLQALAMARSMPLPSLVGLPQAESLTGGLSDQAQAALQALQAAQLQARQQRFNALVHTAAAQLHARTSAVQQARTALLAALTLLALAAAVLVRQWLREPVNGPRRRRAASTVERTAAPVPAPAPAPAPALAPAHASAPAPAPPPAFSTDRQVAGRLMQRLRAAEEAAPAGLGTADAAEQLPSLPPP